MCVQHVERKWVDCASEVAPNPVSFLRSRPSTSHRFAMYGKSKLSPLYVTTT